MLPPATGHITDLSFNSCRVRWSGPVGGGDLAEDGDEGEDIETSKKSKNTKSTRAPDKLENTNSKQRQTEQLNTIEAVAL